MNKKSLIIGTIFLFIDQISKVLIDTFITHNSTIAIIEGFFSITNIYNTGAAFSILEGNTWLLIVLSFIILFILGTMGKEFKKNNRNAIAFGLLIGGIFGNLSDRLFLGMVRDFLKFKIFGYNFPVFNVADICIVIGVGLLIISIFKGEDCSENNSRDRRTYTIR